MHKRDDLRTFAIDGMRDAKALDSDAVNVPHQALEDYVATGYGIVRAERLFP